MKKSIKEFKQLSKAELQKITGGAEATATFEQCGPEAGGARCPDGLCCSQYGWCGSTHEYCVLDCGCISQCTHVCV